MKNYVWEETPNFKKWLISQGAFICHGLRKKEGKWEALLDGRGWFAPQWKTIPEDCLPVIINKQRKEVKP